MIDLDQLKFTSSVEGDELVRGHIKAIVDELNSLSLGSYSVVFIGSFGRGEGTVVRDKAGVYKVINDYDLIIHTPSGLGFFARQRLKGVVRKLEEKLSLWHLDLIPISDSGISKMPPGMLLYDAKFGGQVVHGDSELLSKIQAEEGKPLRPSELLNLLINRQVTLLEAHPELFKEYSLKFKARQLAKIWYALVDLILVENDSYRTRYQEKEQALADLDRTEKIEALLEYRDFSSAARSFKLQGETLADDQLLKVWFRFARLLTDEIQRLTEELSGQDCEEESELFENWRYGNISSDSSMLRCFSRLLFRRKNKVDTEQRLYRLLKAGNPHRDDESLVKDWYNAI